MMEYLPLKIKMFLRSFFVQASWNFDRLQNLGFVLLIFPALSKKYEEDPVSLEHAVMRHTELFNTHPYFAGLVAGAVAVEQGGEHDHGRFLTDLKGSLMSILGGVGDAFFWTALRPLSALAALAFALFGIWWAPIVFLALFNVPHLAVRWWGITVGLRHGRNAARAVQALSLQDKVSYFSAGIAALAGFCAGIASVHPQWEIIPGHGIFSPLAALVVFLVSAFMASRRDASEVVTGALRCLPPVALFLKGVPGL